MTYEAWASLIACGTYMALYAIRVIETWYYDHKKIPPEPVLPSRLSQVDIDHCRLLAEIEVGLVTPEVVEVEDGYYAKKVVLDSPIPVGMVNADGLPPAAIIGTYKEACKIPRYKREIRYNAIP